MPTVDELLGPETAPAPAPGKKTSVDDLLGAEEPQAGQPSRFANFMRDQKPEYPGLVQRVKDVGVFPALKEEGQRIVSAVTAPSAVQQSSDIRHRLESMYEQSPEKASGKNFLAFVGSNDEARKLMMTNPMLFGFSPGEGLARSGIPGVREVPKGMRAIDTVRTPEEVLQDTALKRVTSRLAQDAAVGGPTAQEALDKLAEARAGGKPLTLADLGGENVKALAGNVSRQPGPARNLVKSFMDERDAAAGQRLADDVSRYVASGSMKKTAEGLIEARSKTAAPLYDEAFGANQSVTSKGLDRILETPAGQKALAHARTKMQNDMTLLSKPDPELTALAKEVAELGLMAPHGSGVGVGRGFKLRTWDYVKRSLDDQIGAAIRGGERDDARILTDLKKSLVRELDKLDVTGIAGPNSLKPEGGAYARARAAYSGTTQSLEALDAGRKLLNKSPEEISEEFGKLSPGDKEFYRLGAADLIREKIEKTGIGGDEAKAIIKNERNRRQLRPLFDSDAAFGKFVDSVTNERAMFEARRSVLGGSDTARRSAEDATADFMPYIDIGRGLAHGASGNVLASIGAFLKARRDLGVRSNPLLNLEIAKLLVDPNLGAGVSPGQALLRSFAGPKTQKHLGQAAGQPGQVP